MNNQISMRFGFLPKGNKNYQIFQVINKRARRKGNLSANQKIRIKSNLPEGGSTGIDLNK